jgi:helix-turn-helix protein/WD40 repeat protein
MPARVSLADLSAAGVRLRAAEAAAIVSEICRRITAGDLRGVPSLHVIRLVESGEIRGIVAEGPIGAECATVARAAMLLDDLLPGQAPTPEYRVPGGLRLVALRAQGALDLPPFSGLQDFRASVSRFAAPDLGLVVHDLLELWRIARHAVEAASPVTGAAVAAGPSPVVDPPVETSLTISDIRRARRATGLSLDEIAERSHIPAALLRELEWGYLRNWPGGLYGRTQLVRYARASGLDDRLVVQVAWPLLLDAVEERGTDAADTVPAERPIDALSPPVPVHVVVEPASEITLFRTQSLTRPATRPRHRRLTALAAVAALAVSVLLPAAWEWMRHPATEHLQITSAPPAVTRVSGGVPAAAADRQRTTTLARGPEVSAQTRRTSPTLLDRVVPQPPRVLSAPASYSPSFSNVGTAMFSHETPGRGGLMSDGTDASGTTLKITRVLDDNAQNFHARPSPDGLQLAFDSDRDGTRAVYVADADGRHVRRVSGDGFAAVPSWSPDGRRLAFVKGEPEDVQVWNLWVADLRTGDLRRLTSYRSGQPWGASWFPDGRQIAYSHETDLIVMDLATGGHSAYPTPVAGHLVRTPAVSPDGRHVIFQVQHDGAWLLDLPRGSMRRVLDDPTAEEYTWAPDGHRVAFHSHRAGGWGVWVLAQ